MEIRQYQAQPPQETVIAPHRIADLINEFIASQDVKSSSKALYRRTLKQYFTWIEKKDYTLSAITRKEILEYKQELLSAGMSSLTVGSYITSVRSFYEWTEANKYYPNVAKGIKTPKRKKEFRKQPLTPDQAHKLLSYAEANLSARDYAVINLLLRTGLRTIEVVRADIKDITYREGRRVLLVHGKGWYEKDDFSPIRAKAYQPIAEYLKTRKNAAANEPLFTSISNNNKGGRLTTRTISKIAKDALRAIGIDSKAITAHSFRHTVGSVIYDETGSLERVREVLRHMSTQPSLGYVEFARQRRRLNNSALELLDELY